MGGPGGDCGAQVGDAVEGAAAEPLVGEFFEPPFDEVEPGAGGGVKCRCHRRRSLWANYFVICGVEWADRLSRTTWTPRPRGTLASICLKNHRTSVPVCPLFRSVRTCPVAMFIAANRSMVPFRL